MRRLTALATSKKPSQKTGVGLVWNDVIASFVPSQGQYALQITGAMTRNMSGKDWSEMSYVKAGTKIRVLGLDDTIGDNYLTIPCDLYADETCTWYNDKVVVEKRWHFDNKWVKAYDWFDTGLCDYVSNRTDVDLFPGDPGGDNGTPDDETDDYPSIPANEVFYVVTDEIVYGDYGLILEKIPKTWIEEYPAQPIPRTFSGITRIEQDGAIAGETLVVDYIDEGGVSEDGTAITLVVDSASVNNEMLVINNIGVQGMLKGTVLIPRNNNK